MRNEVGASVLEHFRSQTDSLFSLSRGMSTLSALTNNQVYSPSQMDFENTFGLKKQPHSRTRKLGRIGLAVDRDNYRVCHFQLICSQRCEWCLVAGTAAE